MPGCACGANPFAAPGGVSNWSGSYSLTTPIFQRFNASVNLGYGGTPIYAEAADGTQVRVSAVLGLRPNASVRIEGSLAATHITRDRDGSEYAQSTIPRLKLEYQPRRSLFFRIVTEYRSEHRAALVDPVHGAPIYIDGIPADAQDVNGLRTDVLFSYEPTPGTVVFLGYGASLAKDPLLYQTPDYTRTSDGFFVKLAYMFRR